MFMRKRDRDDGRKVDVPAAISLPGEFATVPCRVRRLSRQGARLDYFGQQRLTPIFRLKLAGEVAARGCRVVRQDGAKVEVEFLVS